MILKSLSILGLILYNVVLSSGAEGVDYSYDRSSDRGPDQWYTFAPECGGKSQSPINIVIQNTSWKMRRNSFKLTKYRDPGTINVENTGKTVRFTFSYQDGENPILAPVSLNSNKYSIVEYHVHFGNETDRGGSEHTINGRYYAAEGHLVTYNLKYESFEEAVTHKDGLLVVGLFYNQKPNCQDYEIFTGLPRVKNEGDTTEIVTKNPILKSILNTLNFDYFSYFGSLTTPTCDEVVTWVVKQQPQCISNNDLRNLRTLVDADGKQIAGNYRPVQELNGRTVYYYRGLAIN